MLEYIDHTMAKARYEIVADDGTYYGSIPGFQGVYANATTLEKCREELQEVLEEWLLIRLRRNMMIPRINGIDLKVRKVA